MDGIHDMGGMHGMGRVPVEADGVFTHDWQKRAFALTDAIGWAVPFNGDQHRHAIERLDPVVYLTADYFDKWTRAAMLLAREAGVADDAEMTSGVKRFDVDAGAHPAARPEEMLSAVRERHPMDFPPDMARPAFHPGDRVRPRRAAPAGHTRLPRYVRGVAGVIEVDHGVFQFADAMARGDGPDPQHCYTVAFDGPDVWGADAEPGTTLRLDLWESYLERA